MGLLISMKTTSFSTPVGKGLSASTGADSSRAFTIMIALGALICAGDGILALKVTFSAESFVQHRNLACAKKSLIGELNGTNKLSTGVPWTVGALKS